VAVAAHIPAWKKVHVKWVRAVIRVALLFSCTVTTDASARARQKPLPTKPLSEPAARNPVLRLDPLFRPTGPLAQEPDHVRLALAMGDTTYAVGLLRQRISNRSTPDEQCLLATLISRTVTSRHEDWRARLEAQRWFERALRGRDDPLCLLEYAGLMEKQGIRVDAGRLARRAFDRIARDSAVHTPEILAEVYYRRALPLADWVREFEHLVFVQDLPVSTPNCVAQAYFCESIVHAEDFRARLRGAPGHQDLVADKRVLLGALLDSALAHDPAHAGGLRLALREAAVARDWERYLAVARRARQADSMSVGMLLLLLAGHVQQDAMESAEAVFDTLLERLGPDAMARYEGLALVADTAMRERLAGTGEVVYGEAVWGLSDPLYLTRHNERRLAHYARIVLADVLYTDPAAGTAGRDTPQGRLVIRYGPPPEVYVVRADRRLQLTPEQQELLHQTLTCATGPIYLGPRTTDKEGACFVPVAAGHSFDAGGRWQFWYYAPDRPPFIFERALGQRTARHMFQTESEHLDSLLYRASPSSYVPPFTVATTSMLVTAFPRPRGAVIEVWARSELPESPALSLGVFLHDRTTGRLVGERQLRRPWTAGSRFDWRLPAPWGKLRVTAEAATVDLGVAGQARAEVDLQPSGVFTLSGLLLGDSATAPPSPRGREDVRFFGRADSVYRPAAPLALYWEIYGLTSSDTTHRDTTVRYRVRFGLRDATDRPLAVSVVQTLGRLLGIQRDITTSIEWEVEHSYSGPVEPQVLGLVLPGIEGAVRVSLTVEDSRTGAVASGSRVIELRRMRRE